MFKEGGSWIRLDWAGGGDDSPQFSHNFHHIIPFFLNDYDNILVAYILAPWNSIWMAMTSDPVVLKNRWVLAKHSSIKVISDLPIDISFYKNLNDYLKASFAALEHQRSLLVLTAYEHKAFTHFALLVLKSLSIQHSSPLLTCLCPLVCSKGWALPKVRKRGKCQKR